MIALQTVWGWQSALYLFLGGLGGGTCLVAMILLLLKNEKYKKYEKVLAVSLWISFFALVVGLCLLMAELSNPARAFLLGESFSNSTSWMAVGAWILFFAVMSIATMVILLVWGSSSSFKAVWRKLPFRKRTARKVLAVVCGMLALCVMIYTGVLLMSASGIPFWNSPLLPVLFTASALGSGVNTVALVLLFVQGSKGSRKSRRVMTRCVIALVAFESVVLIFFMVGALWGDGGNSAQQLAARMSAQTLVCGTLAPYFWLLFVVCGLAVPLVASAVSLLMKPKWARILFLISAAGALAGECTFRFLVVYAGAHADYIAAAAVSLFS